MKKIYLFFFFFIFVFAFFSFSIPVYAAGCSNPNISCSGNEVVGTFSIVGSQGKVLKISVYSAQNQGLLTQRSATATTDGVSFNFGKDLPPSQGSSYDFDIYEQNSLRDLQLCTSRCQDNCPAKLAIPDCGQGGKTVPVNGNIEVSPQNPKTTDTITITTKGLKDGEYYMTTVIKNNDERTRKTDCTTASSGQVVYSAGVLGDGVWNIHTYSSSSTTSCVANSGVAEANINIALPGSNTPVKSCTNKNLILKCQAGENQISAISCSPAYNPNGQNKGWSCPELTNPDERDWTLCYTEINGENEFKCQKPALPNIPCIGYDQEKHICPQVNTAIGIIDVTPEAFIGRIFEIILGFAGIAAFILIVISGYTLMTSGGDKEKVQGARETLISAISGLLFIIFSLAILEFIGIDILRIPGLTPD